MVNIAVGFRLLLFRERTDGCPSLAVDNLFPGTVTRSGQSCGNLCYHCSLDQLEMCKHNLENTFLKSFLWLWQRTSMTEKSNFCYLMLETQS